MCSIIGSFSKDRVKELAELNAYRGQHSHSITVFNTKTYEVRYQSKDFGPLDLDKHIFDENESYIIAHQQAPTTMNINNDSIHPAVIGSNMLWHNGIVKDNNIKKLQVDLGSSNTWDTMLILEKLLQTSTPDDIDGTFSCMWYTGESLFAFRNEISPLFLDNDLTFSSTRFKNSDSINPNIMHKIDLYNRSIEESQSFVTVENPYYFGDE